MKIMNCDFKRFATQLFYNKQSLLLYKSNFKHGIGGIVKIINEYSPIYVTNDPVYGDYKINNFNNENFNQKYANSPEKESFRFIQCTFNNIDSGGDSILRIYASVYLSDNSIYDCSGSNGHMIKLSTRCNTITHVWSINNNYDDSAEFAHVDCKENDFLLILYSTIVSGNTKISKYCIYCQYGRQYHRCLNVSNANWKSDNSPVIQAQAPRCISLSSITLNDINRPSFIFSGSIKDAMKASSDDNKYYLYISLFCNSIGK